MAKTPPKTNSPIPSDPFPKDGSDAFCDKARQGQRRKSSGDLPDASTEAPTQDSKPFKNLRS